MTKPGLSHPTQPYPLLPRQLPGLSRVDGTPGIGWLARYYAVRQVVHQRLFSDSRYGADPTRSRTAACRWLLKSRARDPSLQRGEECPLLLQTATICGTIVAWINYVIPQAVSIRLLTILCGVQSIGARSCASL